MTINWGNPYADRAGQWLKGNLHAHTSPASPCAVISQADLLAAYAEQGYDFLSISDHLALTEAEHPDLVLIPGAEWNSRVGYMPDRSVTHQHHLGLYAPDPEALRPLLAHRVQRDLLDALEGAPRPTGCLVVANHPNWTETGHYDMADLFALAGRVHGLEIYNAVIEREEGQALATGQWDRLLASGRLMLGFASDDSHCLDDIGLAWVVVRAADRTPSAILAAIGSGNFYCSTGVGISDIGRDRDAVFLELAGEARIHVIGRAGRLLCRRFGRAMEWNLADCDSPYVRFEVLGRDWSRAWSQPFFRNGGGS